MIPFIFKNKVRQKKKKLYEITPHIFSDYVYFLYKIVKKKDSQIDDKLPLGMGMGDEGPD